VDPDVVVIAVVTDCTTGRRERTGERSGRSHVHGRVAVVVVVVVAAFVDLTVAVVVEVVADLRSRRNAGATTVVDDSVAVVVDAVAADLGYRTSGNRIADLRDRRACGAGRRSVAEAGADTRRAVCATARTTRVDAADVSGADAALCASAIGRAEVRIRIQVTARKTAEAVHEHDARVADATVVVGT